MALGNSADTWRVSGVFCLDDSGSPCDGFVGGRAVERQDGDAVESPSSMRRAAPTGVKETRCYSTDHGERRGSDDPMTPPAIPREGRTLTGALEPRILDAIVRRIVEVADPEKIILFGSAARGEMTRHSDVDLLVVKEVADKRDLSVRIRRRLYGVDAAVDVIIVTPRDIERYGDSHALVIKPALRDGRVVYAA